MRSPRALVPPAGRAALAWAAALAVACSPPHARPGLPPQPASVAWEYEVRSERPNVDDLAVEARFVPGGPETLGIDDQAAPFVQDVEYASASGWVRVAPGGEGWYVPCAGPECRVRYRFALRAAASALDEADTAIASGDVVVAPPSTWLLHPPHGATQGRFQFHVLSPPGSGFAAGTHPSPEGAADTFEASTEALAASSFAVFGRFHELSIQSGQARVVVVIAPLGLALSDADVGAWVRRGVDAIAAYFGRFPAARTLVIVQAGSAGPTRGETLGDGGPAVLVRAGEGVDAAKTSDDWVITHELLHVSLPSLSRAHAWLDEGLPTYVEPVVRVRAGQITAEKFWGDLVDGLPQGLPEAGDLGLERTHTWGRTYWGGALFCLAADVALRERTHNARSLDDVLRAVVETGANVEAHWAVAHLLDVGDRATGTRVLHELYDRLALAPGTVDLAAMWSRLGVARQGSRVIFDNQAPSADIRRSITGG